MSETSVLKLKEGKQTYLINKAIEKAGSQRKLSKSLGIPKGSINSYKTETYIIPSDRLNRVLKVLDMKLSDIPSFIEKELPKNWGQQIAGNKFISRFSKKEISAYMNYIRQFKKRKEDDFEAPLTSKLCEFFGILMGDGCISEYNDFENAKRCDIVITGDKRFECAYYRYIKSLLKENFGINCYIHEHKVTNNLRLTIRNKRFAKFFLKLGYPSGEKANRIFVPDQFLNLEWGKLKYIIKGLFDTDGTIFAHKRDDYKYPYVGISTRSQKLIQQLYKILRAQGYPFYINNDNLFMKGMKNVNKWMEEIGSSNPKHTFKYNYWLANGKLPAHLDIMGR